MRTPSGQDVSLSEEESHQSRHLLQEGGPLPGPETGLLSNTRKLSEETHVLTKQEILLGKGTRVESSRVREPGKAALPRGAVSGFMVMGLVSWWSFRVLMTENGLLSSLFQRFALQVVLFSIVNQGNDSF